MIRILFETAVATLLMLALHLLVGAALCAIVAAGFSLGRAGRHEAVPWHRASRTLRTTVPFAAATALVAGVLLWLVSSAPESTIEPVRLLLPGIFTVLGAVMTSGCLLLLHAGRLESRGALRAARSEARLGGKTMFLAVDLMLILMLVSFVVRIPAHRETLSDDAFAPIALILLGAASLGIAGFVALLAGLARKPRPSSYFVTALFLLGLLALSMA
jgi:hypothetical protein